MYVDKSIFCSNTIGPILLIVRAIINPYSSGYGQFFPERDKNCHFIGKLCVKITSLFTETI